MKIFWKLIQITILFYWHSSAVNARNVLSSDSSHISAINTMAVNVVMKCYPNLKTIVIHGDSDELSIESIRDEEYLPMILVSDSSMINNAIEYQTKMDFFLMTPNSTSQFKKMLLTFKNSPWWNINASFFILDKSNKECKNAVYILKAAWKMNLIKSLFFCVNSYEKKMVYTYNPYTNRAPQPWKQILITSNQSNGWTMFARSYYIENICNGLNFDRTKHLDGSTIKTVINIPKTHTWVPNEDYNESLYEKMRQYDIDITKALKYSFNATLVFNIDEEGFNVSNGPQGFFKRIQNGSSDVALCLRARPGVFNFTMSYPVVYSEIYISTNKRGLYTPWEKIENFYGIVTLVSMSIILLTTFIVIIVSKKKPRWAFAVFEILRLLVNASLRTQMNKLSIRIFFSMIFLYFLIIQSTFQGHLSSFLTKEEERSNAETLKDLKDPRYETIYVSSTTVPYISDPILKQKLITSDPSCALRIKGKNSAVCLADIAFLLEPAFEYKLHISKQPFRRALYIYISRDDWPLKNRFDMFLMWLEQSGLKEKWQNDYIEQIITSQKKKTLMSETLVRPVSLNMLQFSFIILAIGLALSIICFIFESKICNISKDKKIHTIKTKNRKISS